jgi:hypothetical protein
VGHAWLEVGSLDIGRAEEFEALVERPGR